MVLCSPHAQTGGSISELTPLESQDKAWFPQLYPKDETPNIEPFINQQLMFKKKKSNYFTAIFKAIAHFGPSPSADFSEHNELIGVLN